LAAAVAFEDDMQYTRQQLLQQLQSHAYVTDRSLDVLAVAKGYLGQQEMVYTFGKRRSSDATVAAVAGNAVTFGLSVSTDAVHWSPLAATNAAHRPDHVHWDAAGQKWIVTRSETGEILHGTRMTQLAAVDASTCQIVHMASNGRIYVGISRTSALYYGYDGLHWVKCPTSPLEHGGVEIRTGKVQWNGQLWVAVGGYGVSYKIAHSADGIAWTAVTNTSAVFDVSGSGLGLQWNGQLWVAVGRNANGNLVTNTSQDGVHW
jgi:hypothetical protein